MPAERGARSMAVESARSVLRAADPGRPDIEETRANETMVAMNIAVRTEAHARHYRCGARRGRSRLPRPVAR